MTIEDMGITIREEFEFDGLTIKIDKLKNLLVSENFKNEVLPIITSNLKPLELVLAAVLNEIAPYQEWGLVDSMLISEKEIDSCLIPAFRIMLEYYIPNRQYTDDHLYSLIYDIELLYEIVYSQMKKERTMEFYLRRKLTFLKDMDMVTGINLNLSGLVSKTEGLIERITSKKEPDKEFALET